MMAMRCSAGHGPGSSRLASAVKCCNSTTRYTVPFRLSSSSSGRALSPGTSFDVTDRSKSQPRNQLQHLRWHSSEASDISGRHGSSDSVAPARPSGLRLLDKKRLKKQHDTTKAKKGSKSVTIFGQDSSSPIRARFAPSPTGYMHLGSLRTAALNNIAALASTGGSFILRLEDTDRSRFVEDAEKRLVADLKWAGLKWDEGPDCGGPHGPYRQVSSSCSINESPLTVESIVRETGYLQEACAKAP
jgi:hypothetical protein